MKATAALLRRTDRRVLALVAAVVVLLLAVLTLGVATWAWGDTLRDEQRLLPGTVIAGVDVGDRSIEAATDELRAALAEQLDRPIEVVLDDRTWTVTPRELDASTDVDEVVAAAFDRTTSAGLLDLARLRFGGGGSSEHAVLVEVPDDALTAFVDRVAGEVDADPRDAELAWADGGVQLTPAVDGTEVRRDDAAAALRTAVDDRTVDEVELPVEVTAAELSTETAEQVADAVTAAIDATLDHQVTVTLEGDGRTVTPRELDASVDADTLLADAVERARAGDIEVGDVDLAVADEALNEVIGAVAAGHEVAGRDAQLDWSRDGGFRVTEERTGVGVDRAEAREAVRHALRGGSDTVSLELTTVRPSITTDRFSEVLVVDQVERVVHLYRGGEVIRSWPVAVGLGNSPTPTGMFTVGAKRFEPTWTNPARDRWGANMPAVIPGGQPDNPLGVRALNWNRNGADTLIRFHGTPNEASIGEAASRGCVRMYNRDVMEMYDLVSSGTVILSVAS